MTERKRNIRISVRLTEQEHKALVKICEVTGLSMEGIIRQLITDVQLKPRPPDSYAALARELSAIGNNLNQIAHVANATGQVKTDQLVKAQELLSKTWSLVQERI